MCAKSAALRTGTAKRANWGAARLPNLFLKALFIVASFSLYDDDGDGARRCGGDVAHEPWSFAKNFAEPRWIAEQLFPASCWAIARMQK